MLARSVVRIGKSSQAVIIPFAFCSLLDIKPGDKMTVTICDDKLVLSKNEHERRGVSSTDTSRQAPPTSSDQGGFD